MIPPLASGIVLALAASLSHPHVPDRAPHAVTETRQTAIRPSTAGLHGSATWFAAPRGTAAAGPALRAFLGPHWRGKTVTVCSGGRCVRALLSDWCACGHGRVIDLDRRLFAALAAPSRGVLRVTVSRGSARLGEG